MAGGTLMPIGDGVAGDMTNAAGGMDDGASGGTPWYQYSGVGRCLPTAFAAMFAEREISQVANEISGSGEDETSQTHGTSTHEQARAIEKEHSGLRGTARWSSYIPRSPEVRWQPR